jgi:oligoendopeptidase F
MSDEGLEAGSKWPRHYAADIMNEPDREKRKAMFEKVPERIKDMVYAYCLMANRSGNGRNRQR